MPMVKALLRTLLGALIVVQAWAFDEGIDYTKLAGPLPAQNGDKVEVLEMFLYTCPHCFHLEPTLDKWLASAPASAELVRMPAVFGDRSVPHARAFYAAEMLGKGAQFHLPLFQALHERKEQILDEEALVRFAEQQGIDGEEFRKAYNSFFVDAQVRRAADVVKRYGVDSVPTFVVNGKYRTSPSQTGGRDRMFQVIDHLIAVESGQVVDEDAGAPAVPDS